MAAINGTTGSVTFATGYVANVRKFSFDYSAEMLNSSVFAGGAPKTFIPGQTEWKGTYDCLLDDTTVIVAPGASAAAAVFTASTGRTYSGTILVSNAGVEVAVDGINMVRFSFQGSAGLTIA